MPDPSQSNGPGDRSHKEDKQIASWIITNPTKQDRLRMNVAPDQTIILGLQIFLDHRSLSSIDQKILMIS